MGTRTMQDVFHTSCTVHCLRDIFILKKVYKKTPDNSSAQRFRTQCYTIKPRGFIWFHSFQHHVYLIFLQNNPFRYVHKSFFQCIFLSPLFRSQNNGTLCKVTAQIHAHKSVLVFCMLCASYKAVILSLFSY